MTPVVRIPENTPVESQSEAPNSPLAGNEVVPGVQEAKKVPTLEYIGSIIGEGFKRYFSEAATFARMKAGVFTTFSLVMGSGFVVKLVGSATNSGVDLQWLEIALTSPDLGQTIGVLGALALVIGSNLYYRLRKQKADDKRIELAANPTTPPEVRKAILTSFSK